MSAILQSRIINNLGRARRCLRSLIQYNTRDKKGNEEMRMMKQMKRMIQIMSLMSYEDDTDDETDDETDDTDYKSYVI